MCAKAAPLAAVGLETRNRHANRNAGVAVIAMGAIAKDAATAEASTYQLAVDLSCNQVRRRCNLRTCLFGGQITTGVRGRSIEL